MNNLKINSILDESYSEYFGFTKEEVKDILNYYEKEEKYQEICDWYDGYKFGNTEIFNPWSVINYVADKCFPKAFWQSTGSNEIIGEIISTATPVTRYALGGVNGELISPKVPLRSCRIGAADAVLSEGLHDPVTSSDLRTLFLELFRDEMRLQDIEIPHSPKPLSPTVGYSQQP